MNKSLPPLKFLVDAQLPPSLAKLLLSKGLDSIHASTIKAINNPSDNFLNKVSIKEKRIVITKDNDFYHTFLLKKEPHKLILIRTGNMKKKDLLLLFKTNLERIISCINENKMIEISTNKIVIIY